MNNKVLAVIDALQPNMQDYAGAGKFDYWMDYACYLDELVFNMRLGESIVDLLNKQMKGLSLTAEHHAATDVALTLESLFNSEFGGKFIYE